jgi:hypothetical protein
MRSSSSLHVLRRLLMLRSSSSSSSLNRLLILQEPTCVCVCVCVGRTVFSFSVCSFQDVHAAAESARIVYMFYQEQAV